MVFNVVARNNDDHTKNFSFLMDRKGSWTLVPAYDLCYTYKPGGQWVGQHQLSLNGKRDGFTRQNLMTVGENMDIRLCTGIIDQLVEVVSHWHQYASESGARDAHAKEIVKYLLVKDIGKISNSDRVLTQVSEVKFSKLFRKKKV